MIPILVFTFLVYIIVFLKFKSQKSKTNNKKDLRISVIVSAKNESENISSLLNSLSNQEYDKDSFEVIIVDDESSDNTFSIIENQIKTFPNFSVLKAANKIYEGKRGALQIGIEKARYPYILITDADCEPAEYWIKSFSIKFNFGFDFLFGIAPLKQVDTLANKIACFDNLWTHILSFSFANAGLPYSSSARSFGFNKTSFNKIEGYKNTTETLSGDDDLLLREAVKNKMKIGIVTEEKAFVFSSAKNSVKDFINQKSRHTSTSSFYSLKLKIILAVWHLLNLFFLISPVLVWLNQSFLYLFLFKFIADIVIVKLLMRKFFYRFNLSEILYVQFIYEILIIVNFLNSFRKRNSW